MIKISRKMGIIMFFCLHMFSDTSNAIERDRVDKCAPLYNNPSPAEIIQTASCKAKVLGYNLKDMYVFILDQSDERRALFFDWYDSKKISPDLRKILLGKRYVPIVFSPRCFLDGICRKQKGLTLYMDEDTGKLLYSTIDSYSSLGANNNYYLEELARNSELIRTANNKYITIFNKTRTSLGNKLNRLYIFVNFFTEAEREQFLHPPDPEAGEYSKARDILKNKKFIWIHYVLRALIDNGKPVGIGYSIYIDQATGRILYGQLDGDLPPERRQVFLGE